MFNTILVRWLLVFQSLFSIFLITPGLYITFPENGANVSGIVEIRGSVPVTNFASAEVSYAYADAGETNWFLIAKLDHAVQDDVLGNWDTTTITDGVYQLRLAVTLSNGTVNEIFVKDIHVMNYTHPEGTLPPKAATATESVITPEATAVSADRPTPIPDNPASTDSHQLKISITAGIIAAVLALFLLLVYNALRSLRNRR